MDCLEDDDAQAQELEDIDPEVFMLREQIRMLTKQFYTERQQWLEEKRRLQEAVKPFQTMSSSHTEDGPSRPCSRIDGHQRATSSVLLGSEAGSEAPCAEATHGSHSGREPCSSSCSSAKSTDCTCPHQTGSSSTSPTTNASDANTAELRRTLADTERQLEDSRRHHESAAMRWSREREALQRQIHALISMSGGVVGRFSAACGGEGQDGLSGGSGDSNGLRGHTAQEDEEERLHLTERVSELEVLVEELQAERSNLEEQLRVMAADTAAARRATRAGSLAPPSPSLSSRASFDELAAATIAAAIGAGSSRVLQQATAPPEGVNVTELLAEKAELERELKRYREEFVAVPRAEYTELSSLRSQMAFLQTEMLQVRAEAEEATRLRSAAEAELAQAFQDCVVAEAKAATAAAAAAAAQKKKEEKEEEAAVVEADAVTAIEADSAADADVAAMQFELTALREQLAASVGASVAESSRRAAQVSELQEEVEILTRRNAELIAEAGAVRQALASGQVQASDVAFAAAAAAEKGRAAAEAGHLEAQRRIAALQEELVATHKAAEVALAERDRLSVELAAVRDAALITSQALADCLHGRYSPGGGATATATNESAAPAADPAVSVDPGLQAPEEQVGAAKKAAEAEEGRDKMEAMRRELADSQAARTAAEAAAAVATAALAAVTRDLDATKLELAEARQLELLFQSKRDVFQASKRVTRGLPQEWIYGSPAVTATSRAGGAAAAASAPPPPPPPASRKGSQRDLVSVPVLTETDVEEDATCTTTDPQPAGDGAPPPAL